MNTELKAIHREVLKLGELIDTHLEENTFSEKIMPSKSIPDGTAFEICPASGQRRVLIGGNKYEITRIITPSYFLKINGNNLEEFLESVPKDICNMYDRSMLDLLNVAAGLSGQVVFRPEESIARGDLVDALSLLNYNDKNPKETILVNQGIFKSFQLTMEPISPSDLTESESSREMIISRKRFTDFYALDLSSPIGHSYRTPASVKLTISSNQITIMASLLMARNITNTMAVARSKVSEVVLNDRPI